ncbi:MAG: M23 family metallopeptidase [Pseudonocardiaceae bacterium]
MPRGSGRGRDTPSSAHSSSQCWRGPDFRDPPGYRRSFASGTRGSARVDAGNRVRAGQQIAECGNSGNSSEPHLHIQLMDHAQPLIAAGPPMEFEPFGAHGARMPRNGESFVSPRS